MNRSNLTAKLNRIVLAAVLGTSFAATAYYVLVERLEERETLEAYGQELAALLASNAELGLYTQDATALERVARDAVGRADVARARILNAEGEELATALGEGASRHGRADVQVRAAVRSGDASETEDPLFSASEPVLLGYVELGLSEARALEEGVRRALVSVGIVLVTSLAALAATAVFMRRITRPLLDLKAAAQRVAGGDLSYDVASESPDEVGELARSFAVMVARLKETRDELAAEHGALERKVADRTRELEHRTVEAEAASRVKSQFLANMSHELRTPLNGMLGMNELLLDSSLSSEQKHYAKTIEASGRHLLAIINDVLDFSKVEAGRFEVHPAPCDLRPLLHEVGEPLRARAEAKGVALWIELSDALPRGISTDPLRLRQVITNLLGNAVKFTESGSVTLRAAPSSGGRVRIEVIDTGIGIPAEKQRSVFDAFTQVDGSLTRRFEGTGLGLAISKRIVALLGGELGCESREGHGSTFWVELPAPPLDAKALATLDRAREGQADARVPVSLGLAVLLAEDNLVNQQFAIAALKRLGCATRAVGSGGDAVAAFSAERFDVVLMDGQMPGMDGYQAARRIRELEAERGLAATPIIAVTAHAFDGDRQRALDAGMNAHLPKPYTVAQLAAVLAQHCAANEAPPQALMPPAPELEDEGDAIDPAALADLRGLEGDDDPDFLRDILLSYLDNAPKLLLAIHAALARSDASAAGGAAHTLKSSSAGVAALRLSAVAKEIERACRAGEPVEAALATRLDVEAARAAARLVELLPESKKEPR